MGLPEPYYQDDNAIIYHGDCTDILPNVNAGLLLTDPPYGTQTHDNAKSNKDAGHSVKPIDFEPIDLETLRKILTLGDTDRWAVLTTEFRHAAAFDELPPDGLELIRIGAWVKTNPMPQISADRPAQGWEAIAYLHAKNTKKRWAGGGKHGNYVLNVDHSVNHPTSKPVEMFRDLVANFSEPHELIVDPFMGSGTTLRAAKDLGRKSVGIEIEEKYCEIAANRLAQEVLNFT